MTENATTENAQPLRTRPPATPGAVELTAEQEDVLEALRDVVDPSSGSTA